MWQAAGWFGGGLAGSALTLISQWISRRFMRPTLEIVFTNNESGCRLETNFLGQTDIGATYVRLKIKNRGRTMAQNVSVCTTQLVTAQA
jgi:hypothetical protein